MNESNPIKKCGLSALVILYAVLSLFWCDIFLKAIVYAFSMVHASENSIGIIGGADILATLSFILTRAFLYFLFILLSMVTVFLSAAIALKKIASPKWMLLFCLSASLCLIVFLLIPPQTYTIPLYIVFRKFPFVSYAKVVYCMIAVALICITAFPLIKKRS